MKKTPFTVALDWRPNTNHTGFFVANALGYYDALDLNVKIISTSIDNYKVTPAKKVALGQADVALCPMESIVSYRTKSTPFDAIAIATIFQEDISAITTLKSSGLNSPRKLDAKKYASYQARYEDKIVQQMIKNDGGVGTIDIVYPEKLGIWDTLLQGNADATWIFTNWEGVEAKNKGIELNLFTMRDYEIPYGYSPVIMASEKATREKKAIFLAFMKATKKGFQYAINHPKEAALLLLEHIETKDTSIDLEESQAISSSFYGIAETWGEMNMQKIQDFLDWLKNNGLEVTCFEAPELATNKFI